MSNVIADLLQQWPVLIVDGALATELERRGCDLRDPLWSAKILYEAPDLIRQIHFDYFRAGADIAITASYQATITGFMARGLSHDQSLELLRRSVQLALEARELFWKEPTHRVGRPRPLVAASIGPYGASLADGSEYRGDYSLSQTELMDFHRLRLATLLEAGPDLLACETLPCLIEAKALTQLLSEFPNVNAWMSFSARDAIHISHGENLAECAAWLDSQSQVIAIGINCTAPRYLPTLIQAARTATRKPIVVYPNSGEIYAVERRCWEGTATAAEFAKAAAHWYDSGARLIGGCCRTTPAHIADLASWARNLHASQK